MSTVQSWGWRIQQIDIRVEKRQRKILSPRLALFRVSGPELERKAEMKQSEEKNEEWERRKAFLMRKRLNAVPMCNIKSRFVSTDSRILHGIMKEISPQFDARREDFAGEYRQTY